MSRVEKLCEIVDSILASQEDVDRRRSGFIHLYGVSSLCQLLAHKRGLDPALAAAAGILHDVYVYRTGLPVLHAHNSEEDARVILRDSGDFTEDEQQVIRSAIFNHSDKDRVDEPYAEVLKDADVLHHFLYNTRLPVEQPYLARLESVLAELGIAAPPIRTVPPGFRKRHSVPPTRTRLAAVAEELASKSIAGEANDPDFMAIIRYFPAADPMATFTSNWCASFVYHCCHEAGFMLPIKHPGVPARFAGVSAWLSWAQLLNNGFYYRVSDSGFAPARGDIVVYDNLLDGGPHDHIGIVLGCDNGTIVTAEGNVDNRSGSFKRDRFTNVDGFIRIPDGYRY